MTMLPVMLAHELGERPEGQRWLVEGLWADQAVGMIGGEPKSFKSLVALDLAVSVASGKPCLRHYRAAQTGRVLVFNGEDALPVVRERLGGIATASDLGLENLDIHVITAPSIRLDVGASRNSLTETVVALKPRLLILDPFVRLHAADENMVQEVSPMLGYLRELQRQHQVAVVVVHHFRKGSGKTRHGQALRGSSECHGWGDSNIYLRRVGERITLAVEHRAAPSAEGILLRLRAEAFALEVVEETLDHGARPLTVEDRIVHALGSATAPVAPGVLIEACRARRSAFWQALNKLVCQGSVVKGGAGYSVVPVTLSPSTTVPAARASQ